MFEVNSNLNGSLWCWHAWTTLKFLLSQVSWSHSTCHPPNSFNFQSHKVRVLQDEKTSDLAAEELQDGSGASDNTDCHHPEWDLLNLQTCTCLITNYVYVNQTAVLANYLKRLMEDGLGSKRKLPACGWQTLEGGHPFIWAGRSAMGVISNKLRSELFTIFVRQNVSSLDLRKAFARQSLMQAKEAIPRDIRQIVVQMIFGCWRVRRVPNVQGIH